MFNQGRLVECFIVLGCLCTVSIYVLLALSMNNTPVENRIHSAMYHNLQEIRHLWYLSYLSPASNRHTQSFTLNGTCLTRNTDVENVLCLIRPEFLPEFKNPCWKENATLRCLPYFHVIGVCKTGTTDLFQRLVRHPQMIGNHGVLGKEISYWAWRRYGYVNFHANSVSKMTLNDFINQFDARNISTVVSNDRRWKYPVITGHGDPMDFYDMSFWKYIPQNNPGLLEPAYTTAHLVRHVNPGVKLILLIRNPIDRLYSNYLHGQFGNTSIQFHADTVATLDMLRQCIASRSVKSCLYDEHIMAALRVPISGSFYSIHLQEWLKVFPRQQIFITRTEDFAADVAGTLRDAFEFLEIDPLPPKDLTSLSKLPKMYTTRKKSKAGPILQETRAILYRVFAPYNTALAKLLNDTRYLYN